jgi:uncharacterized protein (DUF433 family)
MTDKWIVSRPDVLGGKPCVRGTRISVEFLLELLASGATHEEILTGYPQLTREGLQAAFEYAARVLKNEIVWELKISA